MINNYKSSSFITSSEVEEHFFAIHSSPGITFPQATEQILLTYKKLLKQKKLTKDSLVFSRIFFSDLANQLESFKNSSLFPEISRGAFSLVQQRPIFTGPISLIAYHIKFPQLKLEKISCLDSEGFHNSVFLRGGNYDLLVTCNASKFASGEGPEEQTTHAFETLEETMARHGMKFQQHSLRTWVFVRDIDLHYSGMCDKRKSFFQKHGLTESTRFLASTGIEAKLHHPQIHVSVDGLAFRNLHPGQIQQLEAPQHLCSTTLYGLTFERGTKITFGDREQFIISGTASIDNRGEIVAPCDVVGQTRRTLENIAALLAPHKADLKDLSHAIVYVRNPHDAPKVLDVLEKCLPKKLPLILVEAAICRPGWLVEIEGQALKATKSEFPNFL